MAANVEFPDLTPTPSDKSEQIENLVLIINCSESLTSQDFITQITKFSTEESSAGLQYHPWRIENKYYCADVKFVVIGSHDEKPEWLKKNKLQITAVIIVFDQSQFCFEVAKQWLPDVELLDSCVLLLVGSKSHQSISSEEESKARSSLTSEILQFSIKHSFEFVDLNEEIDPEDEFPDTVGFARIVQALQATEWPDLHMKGQGSSRIEFANDEQTKIPSENKTAEDAVPQTEFDSLHDVFDGVMDDADLDDENSFDKLFSQMRLMKEKAESLPHTERKAYAEQVAVAFWKAIGGDEDEITDLDKK